MLSPHSVSERPGNHDVLSCVYLFLDLPEAISPPDFLFSASPMWSQALSHLGQGNKTRAATWDVEGSALNPAFGLLLLPAFLWLLGLVFLLHLLLVGQETRQVEQP